LATEIYFEDAGDAESILFSLVGQAACFGRRVHFPLFNFRIFSKEGLTCLANFGPPET
jgi:hypothetical protein